MRILTTIVLSLFLAIGPGGGCGNPAVHRSYYFYSLGELNEHFPKIFKKNDVSIIYVDCSISEKFELIEYEHYFGIHPKYTKLEDENGYIGQYGPTSFRSILKYTYGDIELKIVVAARIEIKNIKLEDFVQLEGKYDNWQHKDSIGTSDNCIDIGVYPIDTTNSDLVFAEREIIINEIKDDIFNCLKVVNRSDFYDDVLE